MKKIKRPKAPLRVLLTDDDEGDRLVFVEIFEEIASEIHVSVLNDGKQLMDYLQKQNSLFPHIIFLDLNMPNLSGLECLKEIRKEEKYNDISIAIYSTSNSQKDIEDTFLYGANIYITKPSDYKKLKQALGKALTAVYHNQDSTFKRENFILKL
ncbi:MAG: response regulator [Balneolales bacterium]|nr:response regulator [Balneolales bacterium]